MNKESLETAYEDVYAVGDVTVVPVVKGVAVSKAGAFAEEGARVVVSHIINKITGQGRLLKYIGTGVCYFEFGGGEVTQINANFLGKERPDVFIEGPSEEFREDKERFAGDRIERWFG